MSRPQEVSHLWADKPPMGEPGPRGRIQLRRELLLLETLPTVQPTSGKNLGLETGSCPATNKPAAAVSRYGGLAAVPAPRDTTHGASASQDSPP